MQLLYCVFEISQNTNFDQSKIIRGNAITLHSSKVGSKSVIEVVGTEC